jgi:hypothetical protein
MKSHCSLSLKSWLINYNVKTSPVLFVTLRSANIITMFDILYPHWWLKKGYPSMLTGGAPSAVLHCVPTRAYLWEMLQKHVEIRCEPWEFSTKRRLSPWMSLDYPGFVVLGILREPPPSPSLEPKKSLRRCFLYAPALSIIVSRLAEKHG